MKIGQRTRSEYQTRIYRGGIRSNLLVGLANCSVIVFEL